MNRVQRALGYAGAVMLVAGVAITAIGPAELGVIDDETDDDETTAAEATDGTPATAASAPESGATAVGIPPEASATRNATDGESPGGRVGDDVPSLSAVG